ncbi:MAG: tetratricopeptide repeat protein, partial [Verrucomicrobiota bacterium]|nr:tetratricopeptide repeat protein [Verrucomicrobiota bacterium]
PHLHELGECEVKHGRKLSLVNFYTDEIGNPAVPTKFSTAHASKTAEVSPKKNAGLWIGIAAAALILAAIAFAIFWQRPSSSASAKSRPSPSSINAKSIAVLPFENLSADSDNAYFADGIQEEILTRLSKISQLKVISRTSTQRYRGSAPNLSEIARQLGVANILEGSVQKAGDQVRVNAQLINALDDSHLWAEKFDRKLTDIFAVESEIASKIADKLQAKLTGAEQTAIATRPTENSEAHQLYLRGRFYWNKWGGADFEKSRDFYEQAIALDPNYALAYAGLADYYGFAFANGVLPPEEKWARLEEENAKKALALDPTLGEAFNPLAAVKLYFYRDWPAAKRDFQRGLELSPNFAEMHQHYALCLVLFGENEEAIAEMKRALDLDPLSPRFNFNSGRLQFFLRNYDAAIVEYRKAIELEPAFPAAHEWLGYALEKKGMEREALAEWSKASPPGDQQMESANPSNTFADSGFSAGVRELTSRKLDRLKEKAASGSYVSANDFALAALRAGETDTAMDWLGKAVQERSRSALEIKINPLFDALRGDPRFTKLMRENLPNE